MTGVSSRIKLVLSILFIALLSGAARGQANLPSCSNCAVWNLPQAPFRIYGDTYYVGPHGLSAILIASDQGHVLIDGALPESAPLIVANIKALGFRIEDVKLILNSHIHFDHAGGIAQLQRLSGATVAVSPWSADLLKQGGVANDDPQFGSIRPVDRVAHLRTLRDGEELRVGKIAMTAHFTPGHTRGGTSWTWKSCEKDLCESMVYADSISAVSADAFKFTKNTTYPDAVSDFERSFAFLDTAPCAILMTPHPEASDLWERMEKRRAGVSPDPMIDRAACRELAKNGRENLRKRVASEAGL